MDEFGFAPPPFKAGEALVGLKRSLRELGLTEREGRFERRGVTLVRAAVDGDAIDAALVKRPSRNSAEWVPRQLRSSAEVRDFVAVVKKALTLWSDRDD